MPTLRSLEFRAGVLSLLILVTLLGIWYAATASNSSGASLAGML